MRDLFGVLVRPDGVKVVRVPEQFDARLMRLMPSTDELCRRALLSSFAPYQQEKHRFSTPIITTQYQELMPVVVKGTAFRWLIGSELMNDIRDSSGMSTRMWSSIATSIAKADWVIVGRKYLESPWFRGKMVELRLRDEAQPPF